MSEEPTARKTATKEGWVCPSTDAVERLEILIDGSPTLGVKGLRGRMERVERMLLYLLIMQVIIAAGTWVTGSDELVTLIGPLLGRVLGGG